MIRGATRCARIAAFQHMQQMNHLQANGRLGQQALKISG
jgi:hypothetical protein